VNIIVCVKQVPGTTEVLMDPITHTIIRDGRQSVVNPFDSAAVELAVRQKESYGGNVTALSMGIPATEGLLRDCIARGADDAVLLTDRRFAGADTLATSYTLSLGIKVIGGYDLILCGKMAVDGDTAQIGPELAEQLGLPHVTDVCGIDKVTKDYLIVTQQTDDERRSIIITLPCVLTVVREIAAVRFPSVESILQSMEADVRVWDADAIKSDPERIGLLGSATQVMRVYVPEKTKNTVVIEGETEQLVQPFLALIETFGGKRA
jgi:electron transfer flavoprotein beta subunit